MLDLFVLDAVSEEKIPAVVRPATENDFASTRNWQTNWKSFFAAGLPNKVALSCTETGELLGLMSYELDQSGLAVEIIYVESARHSNANLLRAEGGRKRYVGIARALFAYAAQVSFDHGFDGVLYFRAKTTELAEYYSKEFGAIAPMRYDPFRMLLLEEAAAKLVSDYV